MADWLSLPHIHYGIEIVTTHLQLERHFGPTDSDKEILTSGLEEKGKEGDAFL